MPTLHVYSRKGCHLCERLIEELLPLVRGRVTVEVRDVDSRDDWRSSYDQRVPVVEFQGQSICQYTLDRAELNRVLNGLAESAAHSD